MKQVIEFIFFPKRNRNYEKIKKGCIYDACKISRVVCPLISFVCAAFLGVSFLTPASYKGDGLMPTFRLYYLILLVGMIIDGAIVLYVLRRFDDRYRIMPTVNAFVVLLLLWWGIRMSYMDYLSFGNRMDATIYMVVSICIPFCQYVDVRVYIVFMTISNLVVTYMFLADGPANAFENTNLTDFLVFSGVQLFLGVVVYFYKYNMRGTVVIQEEQKEEISMLNSAQNRFFSNMSHEIRTPINTIIGLNEMILREDASDEINEDAQNIQAASRMLLHLINDILDMSKFESGQMELNEAPYHTGDMLSDIVGMLWIRAKEKKLDFHVDVSPDLPSELMGDEVRIKQILINVVNNAIKYTAQGSVRLSIQCEKNGNGEAYVSYTVTDTGMGIKKESIPHLFTAFKRVDTEKNKYIEGTGLGLSIVKQFVDLMGGKITVNSVYTKGSTFVIEIPQKIVSDVPVGEFDIEKRQGNRTYTHVDSFEAPEAKILVVDDTSANLMVVTKLLKCTKVQVDTATSGAEALKKTLEKKYDVILMDHKMPGMDGIECMHAIKQQTGGFSRESKIVALTANTGGDVASMYEREGFDGYLTKPVTGDDLEDAVYRMLPRDLITAFGGAHELAEESMAWIRNHKKKVMVRVTTESVADVPVSIQKRYNMDVIPHMVQTDEGLFKDDLEIDTDGLLQYMKDPDVTVLTKSPSDEDHEEFFGRQLDDANNVLHISISANVEHSGCISATRAAETFGNVTVIDSGHLSSGQGLMAIEAAKLAESGVKLDEIVLRLEKMKDHIYTSFIVDTLDFLVRQKQISEYTGRLGKAFMVHPIISLKKGKMAVSKAYMGSRERAWERYIDNVFDVPGEIDTGILFITYVGMTAKDLEWVKERAEKHVVFDEVYIQKASPAIAANCGPGTFGLLFFTKYQ